MHTPRSSRLRSTGLGWLAAFGWLASAALLPPAALAEVSVNINLGPPPPPVVVAAPPALVVVPAIPVVQYAPQLGVDLFFYAGHWYYPHGGYWYAGPSYRGPWHPVAVRALPRPILAVPATYYKVPPGHFRHGGPPGRAWGHGHGRGH